MDVYTIVEIYDWVSEEGLRLYDGYDDYYDRPPLLWPSGGRLSSCIALDLIEKNSWL